ncbi:hypothetical protein TWF225_007635 [Orbilia oligospora]|nr:hypothetical protein TWF225_007635 [Orbilia oligospora]KAF3236516.1 hypothetical protein TWF217_002518 [Orbilia oligospora]KAF3240459.1 hypothetical protein TWF128_011291 [Orbilia oligospora]
MPTAINLGFGIEIESKIRPKVPSDYDYKHLFATLLSSDGLPASAATATATATGTSKYPTDYHKWWITSDGSIRCSQSDSAIGLTLHGVRIPTRNFNAGKWRAEVEKFWSSMKKMFEAKTIAFACCYYEPYIISFMPEERRDHTYCKRNSKVSPRMSLLFKNGDMVAIAEGIRDLSQQSL